MPVLKINLTKENFLQLFEILVQRLQIFKNDIISLEISSENTILKNKKFVLKKRNDENFHIQQFKLKSCIEEKIGTLKVLFKNSLSKKNLNLYEKILKNELENLSVIKSAYVDPLTNLFNRNYIELFNTQLIAKITSCQFVSPLIPCIFMMDIDYFGNFNNMYGHIIGDEVLKAVARKLNLIISSFFPDKSSYILARYGGEEFILICGINKKSAASSLASSILSAIRTIKPVAGDKPITISIGFYADLYFKNIQDAIDKADIALYEAKRAGRNCACNFDSLLHSNAVICEKTGKFFIINRGKLHGIKKDDIYHVYDRNFYTGAPIKVPNSKKIIGTLPVLAKGCLKIVDVKNNLFSIAKLQGNTSPLTINIGDPLLLNPRPDMSTLCENSLATLKISPYFIKKINFKLANYFLFTNLTSSEEDILCSKYKKILLKKENNLKSFLIYTQNIKNIKSIAYKLFSTKTSAVIFKKQDFHLNSLDKLLSFIYTYFKLIAKNKFTYFTAHSIFSFALLLEKVEELEKARDIYRLIIEIVKDKEILFKSILNLSSVYCKLEEHNKALTLLLKYKNDFQLPELYVNLSAIYLLLKDFKKAQTYATKALNLGASKKALLNLAYAMDFSGEYKDSTLKFYNKLLKLFPTDYRLLNNYSWLLLSLNQPQEAYAAAIKAVKANKYSSQCWHTLSEILKVLNKTSASIKCKVMSQKYAQKEKNDRSF